MFTLETSPAGRVRTGLRAWLGFALCWLIAGCASGPPPTVFFGHEEAARRIEILAGTSAPAGVRLYPYYEEEWSQTHPDDFMNTRFSCTKSKVLNGTSSLRVTEVSGNFFRGTYMETDECGGDKRWSVQGRFNAQALFLQFTTNSSEKTSIRRFDIQESGRKLLPSAGFTASGSYKFPRSGEKLGGTEKTYTTTEFVAAGSGLGRQEELAERAQDGARAVRRRKQQESSEMLSNAFGALSGVAAEEKAKAARSQAALDATIRQAQVSAAQQRQREAETRAQEEKARKARARAQAAQTAPRQNEEGPRQRDENRVASPGRDPDGARVVSQTRATNSSSASSAGSRSTASNPKEKADPRLIDFKEGVVVCAPGDANKGPWGSGARFCDGPFQRALVEEKGPAMLASLGNACGSTKGNIRELGTFKNHRVFGCGFGINPMLKGWPNIDAAAKYDLIIPARVVFRCEETKDGYCMTR